MQKFYLFVAEAVVFSAVAGVSLATVFRQSPIKEQPLVQTSPIQPQPLKEIEVTTSPIAETKKKNSTETTPSAQAKRSEGVSIPKFDDFPHQRVSFQDDVKPGSEFWQFRQQLRQAIGDRNAQFVRSILPEKEIGIGFGSRVTADIKLENPNEEFWSLIEKAVSIGCFPEASQDRPNVDTSAGVWVCNNVAQAFYRQYPNFSSQPGVEYQINHVVIVGNNVNVRAQPNSTSRIVGLLTNEVVKLNRPVQEQQLKKLTDQGQFYDSINSWTPVILPNNQQGFVSSRYAYSLLEYQAVFGKVNGQWQLLGLPGGD